MNMKKLVAYLTCSLPDKAFTIDAALALKESGVDSLELGIPFTDPCADGPVIEKANLESLRQGFKIDDIFDVSREIGSHIDTLWMGYCNPFFRKGMDYFQKNACNMGVSGFIIPDLPHEESRPLKESFRQCGVSLIDFVAPTDTKERIETIVSDSEKFIYLVAYAGITGMGRAEDLSEVIGHIRSCTDTPVYLGFGVNKDNAREKAESVDGVIVGSAFVNILMDTSLTNNEKLSTITALSSEIKEKINS